MNASRRNHTRVRRGFSAIELAVVLGVFVIVLLLGLPHLKTWRRQLLNNRLVEALESDDVATVKKLLRRGASPHGNRGPGSLLLSSSRNSPHCLHCGAILWGDTELARYVFPEVGEGASSLPPYHHPPFLNLAVARNSVEMAAILLEAGADLNERLQYAYATRPPIEPGRDEAPMLALLEHYHTAELGAEQNAASAPHAARVALRGTLTGIVIETEVTLVGDNQYNMEVTDAAIFTLLHDAVALDSEGLLRLLLSHGADPTVEDHTGEMPRAYAKRLGRCELATILAAGEKLGL